MAPATPAGADEPRPPAAAQHRRTLVARPAPTYRAGLPYEKNGPRARQLGAAMLDPVEIAIFAVLGLGVAIVVAVLSRWSGRGVARVAAYALIAVAFLYVGFAFRADNPKAWVGVEMTGVAIFGSLAMMGTIGSPWFVVAGLALHPAWAIVFHYVGTGSDFTPPPVAVATAAFDAALALWTAYSVYSARREKASAGELEPAIARAKNKGRAR